mgnify:CR=1 FL=1
MANENQNAEVESVTVRSELNRVSSDLTELTSGLSRVNEDLAALRERLYQVVPIVTLALAKQYLRVDSTDEDELIDGLILSAESLCRDVARLSMEQWEDLGQVTIDSDGAVVTIRSEMYSQSEVIQMREVLKVAILYSVGYLYEHREEADHHDLTLTLRNLLFSIREGSF